MATKESKSLSFGKRGISGSVIYIGVLLPLISAQQIPTLFTFPVTSESVNGSSATANCTNATSMANRYECRNPNSSVVYDGVIPTLTGLDGNMWASQLLTIKASSATLEFNFTDTHNFEVERVEIVVFNCPQWGISFESVNLLASGVIGSATPTLSSCDSLVKFCIIPDICSTPFQSMNMKFTSNSTDWIHIAEVGFYAANSGILCPPEMCITEPTTATISAVSSAPTTGTTSNTDSTTETSTSLTISMARNIISENAGALAAGAIIVLLLVVIAVIVIVIVCLKRSHGRFQSSIKNESNIKKMGTIEHIEMDKRVQHVSTCEGEGGPIYDTVAKPTAVAETAYEAVDLIPSQNGIVKVHSTTTDDKDMYIRLGEIEQGKTSSKPQVNNGQDLYYQLEEKSDVDPVKTPEQPVIYAMVNKPKRCKPPSQPNPPPADEYATVDEHRSPAVPMKSDDLLAELSQQEAENEASSPSSLVASTSKSNECLGEKPLHCSTENLFPPHGAVCTETGTPLPNESGSIYEQIYEVKTLAPSAFIKESYPEESHEGLYPCSSIYTIPEVNIEEEPLELSSHNVQVVKKLGSGNFGDVVLAKTVGLSCKDLKMSSSTDTNVQVLVAVKMLKQNAHMMDKTLFDKECKFMVRLNHPNVIRLLGVCKTSTPFIMMEYMENGDLNQYLKAFESIIFSESPEGNSKENKTITTTTLISLCTQIASAMKYLASKNFVHRDLATRNCLVGSNYQVKIADFGMSRNMYESHYYVIKGHAILPIRWMATECFYGQFSAKTDVWAFGVTMWEIFELARNEPYYETEDKDLVKDAIKGKNRKLLPCPKACPEEVYRIMNLCWAHKSSDRETFENLYQALSSL